MKKALKSLRKLMRTLIVALQQIQQTITRGLKIPSTGANYGPRLGVRITAGCFGSQLLSIDCL